MAAPHLVEELTKIAEVLDVAALVRAHGDGLDVLVYRGDRDVADAPVMTEVDDLASACLQDAAHDVDRCVVSVEE
jgi:hypothetical protein